MTLIFTIFLQSQAPLDDFSFLPLMTVESASGSASTTACLHSPWFSLQYLDEFFARAMAAKTGAASSLVISSRADLPNSLTRLLSLDIGGSLRTTLPTSRIYFFCFSVRLALSQIVASHTANHTHSDLHGLDTFPAEVSFLQKCSCARLYNIRDHIPAAFLDHVNFPYVGLFEIAKGMI